MSSSRIEGKEGETTVEEARDSLKFSPLPPTKGPLLIAEVLPKSGLLYSERGSMTEVLCKPKILPIKSIAMMAVERRVKAETAQGSEEDAGDERGFG
jgi:BBSome-interacting protein 1